MSITKLHKLKHGLDSLHLKIQQLEEDLHSSYLDMEGDVGQPFGNNEEGRNWQDNEPNFDLPPRFDEYEEDDDCKIREQVSWRMS